MLTPKTTIKFQFGAIGGEVNLSSSSLRIG